MNKEIAFVKINGEENTIIRDKFGISAYPTMVLLNKQGEEIDRIIGYEPPVEFINTITMYLEGKGTLQDYLERVEASPDSIELIFTLGEKYEGRNERDKAMDYYERVIRMDPQNENGFTAKATHSMSWLSYRNGDIPRAIEWEEAIIEKYQDSELYADAHTYIPYYYMQWAQQAEKAGERSSARAYRRTAIERFETFIDKFPEHSDVEWAKEQVDKLKES
ncbi:MAG: hypothetical protein GF315_04585 [candidate division Zixibacteria bacterium]|nr:hypothetical protein [candidate division Zixibacteria bacterium]